MTPAVRPDPTLHANGLKAGPLLEQSLASLTEEQARILINKAAEARLPCATRVAEKGDVARCPEDTGKPEATPLCQG
jgi:hypothetical protein